MPRPLVLTVRLLVIVGIALALTLVLAGPTGLTLVKVYQHRHDGASPGPNAGPNDSRTERLLGQVQTDWNASRWGPLQVVPTAPPGLPATDVAVLASTADGTAFWVVESPVRPLYGTSSGIERRIVINLPKGRPVLAAQLQDLFDAGPAVTDAAHEADDPDAVDLDRTPLVPGSTLNQRLAREGTTVLLLTRDDEAQGWHWQVSGPYERRAVVLDALADDHRMLVRAMTEAQATVASATARSGPSAQPRPASPESRPASGLQLTFSSPRRPDPANSPVRERP